MRVFRPSAFALASAVCVARAAQHDTSFTSSLAKGMRTSLHFVWDSTAGFTHKMAQSPFLHEATEAEYPLIDRIPSATDQIHAPEWMLKGVEEINGIQSSENGTRFCDPDVKQISGYLDIREGAHLWFMLYESRSSPKSDPLVMWLNGGPGCSSSTGMLFELGPCNIANKGESVERNKYSWNSEANLLFLDQPLQVGYSYSDKEEVIDTSVKSAEDVYAFLQLFFSRFPQYAELPFTVAAESYGGHYAPHIGAEIHKKNKQLTEQASTSDFAPILHVNLESLMLGNGLTDPKVQFQSVPEYACSPDNKYHLFEPGSEMCESLYNKADTCNMLIDQCDRFQNRLVCVPAALFCWGSLYGPVQDLGVNLYDVRQTCDHEKDGELCYPQMDWIETLMNKPETKKQLGVPSHIKFQSCNMQLNQHFMMQGDSLVNSAELLRPLLGDGIRVLVYAGETDFMCNAIGNHEWVLDFPNPFNEEINNATEKPLYFFSNGLKPQRAGYVVQAGENAGNLTYAWINNAGHMVPHDQPAVALNMLNRWVRNKDLTSFTP